MRQREANGAGDEFASGALVALIERALRERDPGLVPPQPGALAGSRSAHSPSARKRELLERARREFGDGFVFGIGAGIGAFEGHPVLDAFLRSPDGHVLLDKWARFERHAHARHRTRIERRGPCEYEIRHLALRGPAPGRSHDLFILGVIRSLLEAIGERDLCISLLPGDRPLVRSGRRLAAGDDVLRGPTDRWRIRWTPRGQAPAPVADECAGEPPGFAERARRLLASDPARSWTVAALSEQLALAPRSLQRALRAEKTSYSALLLAVRVGAACRLIETASHPMTVVAYVCGFADAAHLSREFRAAVGATPTQFRDVVRPHAAAAP